MSEHFDPYYKWLGIHPKDQPPHHYRLLGVEPFETDAEVIEAAADRHVAYLQDVAGGPHIRESQRLLNEIAVARLCLLDDDKKRAYDRTLRTRLATEGKAASSPAATPPTAPPVATTAPAVPPPAETSRAAVPADHVVVRDDISKPVAGRARKRLRKSGGSLDRRWIVAGIGGAVAVAVVLVIVVAVRSRSSGNQTEKPRQPVTQERETAAAVPSVDNDAPSRAAPREAVEPDSVIETPDWNPADLTGPTDDASSLVAHYPFDDADRPGADATGAYPDSSINATFEFDADRESRVLILAGEDSCFEIARPVQENFTIALWIRTEQKDGGGTYWHQGPGIVDGDVDGPAEDFGLSLMKGSVAFGVGTRGTTVKSNRPVNDGHWHHVAVTRESSTGEITIFVDGVLDNRREAPTGRKDAAPRLSIGRTQSKPQFFQGRVDDLRFYNYVLSDEEIEQLAR